MHNKDDIIPISLGTNVKNNSTNPEVKKEGDIMSIIIKRGTHIPISKCETYSTVYENQDTMSINIYEGEKKFVKYNHLLKKSNITGLTKRPKGQTNVVMKFDFDINGIEVKVRPGGPIYIENKYSKNHSIS